MIDFAKFTKPFKTIVPVKSKKFQYLDKSYEVQESCFDSWYQVEIAGNKVSLLDQYPEIPYKTYKGYTYNNKFIFKNFNVALRNWGFKNILFDLHFNNVVTFSAVKVVVWESKDIFLVETDYSDVEIELLLEAFDERKSTSSLKGITPELSTLFLFHEVQRQQQEALLAKIEEEKKLEELNKLEDLSDPKERLIKTFLKAGAVIENFTTKGNHFVVDWHIPEQSYKYNSVIDQNTWMVIEAGICVSDDDDRLNITSLVKTADQYAKEGLTYITRRRR